MVARSRTGLVALVLAAGLGVAGCAGTGTPRSSTALEVGDRTVTVEELQNQAEKLSAANPKSQSASNESGSVQQSLLSQKIMDQLNAELARRAGVTVDEKRVNDLKKQFRKQLKQSDQSLPEPMIDAAARRQLISGRIPEILLGKDYQQQLQNNPNLDLNKRYNKAISKVAGDLGVDVNPRYGSWNPDADFVQALQGGSVLDPQGGQLAEISDPRQQQQQPPITGQ